jgi:geranylgeranyl diphosphate synthase type I
MQSLGDLAVLGCAQRGVPLATTLRISQLLTESYLEMIEGQCQDLGFESRTSIATGDYLQMIAYKTGALIRSSLEIGAVLATDDLDNTLAFARFGSCLGRAFQIRDDFLGIWGDEATTGKSTDSDIRRRKKSFPVVFAFERATGAAGEDLHRIYSQEALEESDIDRVLDVLEEVGASESTQRLTQESASQALEALQAVTLPSWAKTEVEELVEFLALRQF